MSKINDSSSHNHQSMLQLTFMPLREVVVFPYSIVPLFVGRELSIKAVDAALEYFDKKILLVAQHNPEQEKPELEDLLKIATVAKILQVLRLPDGTVKVLVEGLERATWETADVERDFTKYKHLDIPILNAFTQTDEVMETPEISALVYTVKEAFLEYVRIKKVARDNLNILSSVSSPGQVADIVMSHLRLDYQKKQNVFETIDPLERLNAVYKLLSNEITVAAVEGEIKSRVKEQMEKNQREYYLTEQVKAIHKELGRDEDPQLEFAELVKKLAQKDMPDFARERGESELKKLRYIPPTSAEYTVVRNYIDWILELPWNKLKDTDINILEAKDILDKEHFGLDKPKERILEYLAVQKLSKKLKGPILCLVGPPGVGKTSLAKSISHATQRDFVRLSLGGVRDEAEIRGHRRTYVGALPGKIIQSLKRTKFNNPLFCLDEIDKMTSDFRGDPSSALLEVLDPEQNNTFNDHYLDLDYDLSKVMFITTANSLYDIPLPLLDRMEVIRLSGYLENEKLHIAKDFLLPKQIEENGLQVKNIKISDKAILEIIRTYTKEAGVRNLERELAKVCRKIAMQLVEQNNLELSVKVGVQSLAKLLGIKKYRYGEREKESQIGVCTGLAYTEVGGELLMVETAIMPGTGAVNITGKLGEVMQESAKAALSYVRSRSNMLGLRSSFHKDIDLHIHVPDGATPKDGPSAGITLTTSLVSALLGIPVRPDLAMTGEVTLRGRVLPIGGLREKLLAAHRGSIKHVIVPKDNAKDLKEVPSEIMRHLQIHLVEHVDEVLPLALNTSKEELFKNCHEPLDLCQSLGKGALSQDTTLNPQ